MRTMTIDWLEFNRSRVTFYSRSNNKRYSGWLLQGEGDSIRILSKDLPNAEPSEAFLFQIFGRMHDLLCGATFAQREASSTKIEESTTEVLHFLREDLVRVQNTRSELRRSLHGLTGKTFVGEFDGFDVALQDVSKQGIAFIGPLELRIGQEGRLSVPSEFGDILLNFSVKNSKKMPQDHDEPSIRIGATIDPVDRISSINLKRVLESK